MANIRQIRRRIRSVQNTAKITKAMQMIAASKMRKAQQLTLANRPYAEKLQTVLADLAAQPTESGDIHPILQQRKVAHTTIIHITPDRGLCGGLNANINRMAGQFIIEEQTQTSIIAVGKKGRDFMIRYGRDVRAVFVDLGDRPSSLEALPIAYQVINDYTNHKTDRVMISYSQFINTVVQKPIIQQLLPVKPATLEMSQTIGYIYEPSAEEVLSSLLPRFVEVEIYQAILESIASEQSARMVAMRNATDSASEMIDALTLMMNKARQETITTELLDIVGGVAALG